MAVPGEIPGRREIQDPMDRESRKEVLTRAESQELVTSGSKIDTNVFNKEAKALTIDKAGSNSLTAAIAEGYFEKSYLKCTAEQQNEIDKVTKILLEDYGIAADLMWKGDVVELDFSKNPAEFQLRLGGTENPDEILVGKLEANPAAREAALKHTHEMLGSLRTTVEADWYAGLKTHAMQSAIDKGSIYGVFMVLNSGKATKADRIAFFKESPFTPDIMDIANQDLSDSQKMDRIDGGGYRGTAEQNLAIVKALGTLIEHGAGTEDKLYDGSLIDFTQEDIDVIIGYLNGDSRISGKVTLGRPEYFPAEAGGSARVSVTVTNPYGSTKTYFTEVKNGQSRQDIAKALADQIALDLSENEKPEDLEVSELTPEQRELLQNLNDWNGTVDHFRESVKLLNTDSSEDGVWSAEELESRFRQDINVIGGVEYQGEEASTAKHVGVAENLFDYGTSPNVEHWRVYADLANLRDVCEAKAEELYALTDVSNEDLASAKVQLDETLSRLRAEMSILRDTADIPAYDEDAAYREELRAQTIESRAIPFDRFFQPFILDNAGVMDIVSPAADRLDAKAENAVYDALRLAGSRNGFTVRRGGGESDLIIDITEGSRENDMGLNPFLKLPKGTYYLNLNVKPKSTSRGYKIDELSLDVYTYIYPKKYNKIGDYWEQMPRSRMDIINEPNVLKDGEEKVSKRRESFDQAVDVYRSHINGLKGDYQRDIDAYKDIRGKLAFNASNIQNAEALDPNSEGASDLLLGLNGKKELLLQDLRDFITVYDPSFTESATSSYLREGASVQVLNMDTEFNNFIAFRSAASPYVERQYSSEFNQMESDLRQLKEDYADLVHGAVLTYYKYLEGGDKYDDTEGRPKEKGPWDNSSADNRKGFKSSRGPRVSTDGVSESTE